MIKRPQEPTASDLTTREHILLFSVANGTDWQRAGVPGETVTAMVVKGLVVGDALGRLGVLRPAGVRCCGRCCRG